MRNVWYQLAFLSLTTPGALCGQTAKGQLQTTPAAILTHLDVNSAEILYHDRNDHAFILDFVITTFTQRAGISEEDTVCISYIDQGTQHIAQSIEIYPKREKIKIYATPGGIGGVASNTKHLIYSREGEEAIDMALAKGGAEGADEHSAHAAPAQAVHRVDSLDAVVKGLDSYKPLANVSVTFGFDKAALTKEDIEQLDSFAKQLGSAKDYILEVTGGTDSIGPAEDDYQLSQRRADAVVQYLAEKHLVPPSRFYLIGIGKDDEVAPNTTSAGRKQNRSVRIQLLTKMGDDGTHHPPS